jgi:hypothetical protein
MRTDFHPADSLVRLQPGWWEQRVQYSAKFTIAAKWSMRKNRFTVTDGAFCLKSKSAKTPLSLPAGCDMLLARS